MKYCPRCREDKPLNDFNRSRSRNDGVQPCCRLCQSNHDKRTYKESPGRRTSLILKMRGQKMRNKATVAEYIRIHPCVDCRESDPIVLDFDHVRGEKKYSISDLCGARGYCSHERLMAEIAKCDIRCANCHRRVTARRRLGDVA